MLNGCKTVEMLSCPLWFPKDFSKHIQFLARRITYIWGKTCLSDAGRNIPAAAFSRSSRSSMRRFKHTKWDLGLNGNIWWSLQGDRWKFLCSLALCPTSNNLLIAAFNSISTELNSRHIIVSHFLHLSWCKSWILHVIPKQLKERKSSPLNKKHLK